VVGHAPDRITVVLSVDELNTLPDWSDRKLGLTCQTTASLEDFVRFQRGRQGEVASSGKYLIRSAMPPTSARTAIMDLAPQVDMILVVGSQTSANSRRLASISDDLRQGAS